MAYTTIDKPSDYFNTVLYTGTATTQSITGVGFQPDFVWIKRRGSAEDHASFDVVRGATKRLFPSRDFAESISATTLTSFDSDGFTLGGSDATNGSDTYASWNWLADNTSGSSNTDGSITSTVSANTTSGFSVAIFTGNGTGSATIGHGLGVAPKFVIIKNRGRNGESWQTWFDNNKRLNLNSTSVSFIATHPISTSSTVVTTPSTVDSGWNLSGDTYVMYSFAEVKGFSKFGSYTGNGSSDGTFIYTGFKPAWVVVKRTSAADNWIMHDNKRVGYNPVYNRLHVNGSDAEFTSAFGIDILSNGFKCRTNDGNWNASGNEYIYMAFAENPFVTSTGIPATAR